MEKKIRFRAIMVGTNAWVYGLPSRCYRESYIDGIIDDDNNFEYIRTDTLGQFTGLKDKKGNDIYVGDIIKLSTSTLEGNFLIINYNGCFSAINYKFINDLDKAIHFSISWMIDCGGVVIGNIYNNPELLKQS